MKKRRFFTKRVTDKPIKKSVAKKNQEVRKKHSLFSFLNGIFMILIFLELFGTLAFNSDVLFSKFLKTTQTVTNGYENITVGFEAEKKIFKLAFLSFHKQPAAQNKITLHTATPTSQLPSITGQPTNTSIPTPIDTSIPEPTFIPTILTPTPAITFIPTPAAIIKNPENTASQQPINSFALGEKSLFGSSTNIAAPYTILTGENPHTPLSKFAGGQIKNVFIIVMENSNWINILGNTIAAPFINERLLPQASYANNYYNPIGLHPSEPNYIWLEAGSNTGIGGRSFTTDDDPSFINSTDTVSHLTTMLQKNHISWKSYFEGIDGTSCPTTNNELYVVKHNPMVFFQDVFNNAPYCIAHERPMEEFTKDVQKEQVSQFNFIVPNVCNDMNVACAPSNNSIQQGDKWLSVTIPKILDSNTYKDGGLILILWNEGKENKDGPIGLIALSPFVKGNGYSNDVYYTHSSTLKTIEEIFGVPFLRDSANANDLSDLFIDTQPDVSLSLSPLQLINIFSPTIFANSFEK